MKDGNLLKEGAEKLRDKYFLSPKQFNRLNAPTLYDTKLHCIQDLEFKGLSEKLFKIHRDHRVVVKLSLKLWETIAASDTVFSSYEGVPTHYSDGTEEGPLPDYTLPELKYFTDDESDFARGEVSRMIQLVEDDSAGCLPRMCTELYGRRQQVKFLTKMVLSLMESKQRDYDAANFAKKLHSQHKDLMMDTLTLMGQEDLAIKQAREFGLKEHLHPVFETALKSAGIIYFVLYLPYPQGVVYQSLCLSDHMYQSWYWLDGIGQFFWYHLIQTRVPPSSPSSPSPLSKSAPPTLKSL